LGGRLAVCQSYRRTPNAPGDGRAILVAGDLADLAAFKRESEQLAADVDGFDFLVDNAAIDPVEPIEAYSPEDFLAVQTINADAAFVLRQTLAPHMKRKGAAACERRHIQGLKNAFIANSGRLATMWMFATEKLNPSSREELQ
jgi:NAD(P)-dependent dehydrogenase (short-subunit alcohol dehydrogenase family)